MRDDNFNGYVNDEYRHNKRDDGGLENARGDDYGARLIIHLRGDRVDDVHHGYARDRARDTHADVRAKVGLLRHRNDEGTCDIWGGIKNRRTI